MSIHRLTAGSGYDYLTRQVARQDATEVGHSGLGSYYTAKGEAPGVWVGAGMTGIHGLAVGDEVTAEQMTRLFGTGEHPLGDESGHSLGRPFRVYGGRDDITPFRIEVARRFEKHNKSLGLPVDHPIPVEERAAIRTQVGRQMFRAEHGRDPFDERELSGHIAKQSRPRTTAVAGFDLTFSPVKSVSTLWAVADRPLAVQIEAAHQGAVRDAPPPALHQVGARDLRAPPARRGAGAGRAPQRPRAASTQWPGRVLAEGLRAGLPRPAVRPAGQGRRRHARQPPQDLAPPRAGEGSCRLSARPHHPHESTALAEVPRAARPGTTCPRRHIA